MSHFQTVGVIGKRRDPKVLPTLATLCQVLLELGREVLLATDSGGGAAIPPGVRRADRDEIHRRCSLVVVVGGDGTLLSAARDCAGLPILGINQGRLGFMVDVRPEEMRETLAAVFAGEHVEEDRLLLSASIRRGKSVLGPYPAVNDVVIRNQATIRMLEFETWLDGEFISQHRADGFIVSSPTGSTAYALSSGGPVLHPSLDAIALVPICPHTLSDRPIVVGARQTVRVVLRGGEGVSAMFTCDGQTTENLHPGDALEVRAAEHRLRLIHPRNYSYFNILRNKLHWGRGPQQDR
ncbi:MAG TPA: NAD(+) kinase [Solimonas sp.]|nr:NAD(+) kinase [Solimonas sp.]